MIDYTKRIELLKKYLNSEQVDAILISKEENIRYFTGFTGDSTVILFTVEKGYLITDGRYIEQAKAEIPKEFYEVIQHKQGIIKGVIDLIGKLNLSALLVEGLNLVLSDYLGLENGINSNGYKTKIVTGSLDHLRIIKDEYELLCLKKAVEIADKGFTYILGEIKPGVSEFEIARKLEYYMGTLGSERPAFTTIVASGKRGALPHGVASNKLINSGEFVTIDFGAVYAGYHSDITRTIAVGNVDLEMKKIYESVLDAQLLGLKTIAPGVKGCDIDRIVRERISELGYGQYFIHGLGHGVGLEIHELPRLSASWSAELLPNMVVTNEPGIYLPDQGGVRIEDTVLVTSTGCQPLTQSEKQLIIL